MAKRLVSIALVLSFSAPPAMGSFDILAWLKRSPCARLAGVSLRDLSIGTFAAFGRSTIDQIETGQLEVVQRPAANGRFQFVLVPSSPSLPYEHRFANWVNFVRDYDKFVELIQEESGSVLTQRDVGALRRPGMFEGICFATVCVVGISSTLLGVTSIFFLGDLRPLGWINLALGGIVTSWFPGTVNRLFSSFGAEAIRVENAPRVRAAVNHVAAQVGDDAIIFVAGQGDGPDVANLLSEGGGVVLQGSDKDQFVGALRHLTSGKALDVEIENPAIKALLTLDPESSGIYDQDGVGIFAPGGLQAAYESFSEGQSSGVTDQVQMERLDAGVGRIRHSHGRPIRHSDSDEAIAADQALLAHVGMGNRHQLAGFMSFEFADADVEIIEWISESGAAENIEAQLLVALIGKAKLNRKEEISVAAEGVSARQVQLLTQEGFELQGTRYVLRY